MAVVTVAAIAMAVALWNGATGRAQEAAPGGGPDGARAEAIRPSLAVIEGQLQEHGGTWAKWSERLKTYREDLQGCFKFKWPWPAEKNYVFQGAAIEIIRRESFDDLLDGERPLDSLVHFSRRLKALGVDLIVAIIPSKLAVYPDYIHTGAEGAEGSGTWAARAPADRIVSLAVIKLMYDLLRNDVEVVNLHEEFRQFRLKHGDGTPLFYVRDAHYLNRGAQLAAEKIAQRLKRYDFVQKALAGENPFVGEKGARSDGDKADDTLLLIKDRAGRPYRNSADSPVFALGDSHFGYNTSTAPFSGQIAYRIALPVSEKWREGLAASIPTEVAKDPNLKKRRVVIVHYSERMMRPKTKDGGLKWPVVNLPDVDPAKANAAPLVKSAAR
jgi:hypothetical protein